jgi:acyl-CoA thioesterase-1
MRPLVPGSAFVVAVSFALALAVAACSRNTPSSAAPPPPAVLAPQATGASSPTPTTSTGATLRFATAVEEPGDAGTVLPSLAGKTVLHVGDSMVGGTWGLTKALEQRFCAEGAKFIRDYKVSESIISYDHSPKLKALIDKHRPDIVIITLGTNDVFVPYPASMAGNVQNIVKRVGARACYWMGPPTWKPDTGIVNVLKDNVAPCKFFDSSNLKLQRAGDGIHPTDRGGADWATTFWTFFRPGAAPAPQPDAGATSP